MIISGKCEIEQSSYELHGSIKNTNIITAVLHLTIRMLGGIRIGKMVNMFV